MVFGSFGTPGRWCAPPRAFHPRDVPAVVAMWSAKDVSGATLPNRIASSVAALTFPGSAPTFEVLSNGVRVCRFGDASYASAPDAAALRFVGSRGYWAFHLRRGLPGGNCTVASQWGAAERLAIIADVNDYALKIYVATSATAYAMAVRQLPFEAVEKGCFVEVMYDGGLAASDRIKATIDGVELVSETGSGSVPASMLPGDAASFQVGALNGSGTGRMDLTHLYVANDVPSPAERARLRAFEQPDWSPYASLYARPQFVHFTTTSSTGTSYTQTWPSHRAGDIGIFLCETRDTVLPTPTGWTAIPNGAQTGGSAGSGSATQTSLQAFWRRAETGNEPTFTVAAAADHRLTAFMIFRACVATGDPIDVSAGVSNAGNALTLSIPGATTTVANCLVVAVASISAVGIALSGVENASLADLQMPVDVQTISGNDGVITVFTGVKAAAGPYAATTGSFANYASRAQLSFALKPL